MRKSPANKNVCGKSSKSISGNTLSQRESYGYRPAGNRTSDCSSGPNGGSSIKSVKNK